MLKHAIVFPGTDIPVPKHLRLPNFREPSTLASKLEYALERALTLFHPAQPDRTEATGYRYKHKGKGRFDVYQPKEVRPHKHVSRHSVNLFTMECTCKAYQGSVELCVRANQPGAAFCKHLLALTHELQRTLGLPLFEAMFVTQSQPILLPSAEKTVSPVFKPVEEQTAVAA